MIDFQVSEFIHRQIVVEMTIRTLERDRKHLANLKMQRAFDLWMDLKIKELKELLRKIKYELGKKGVKIKGEQVEGEFINYEILERGKVIERRYSAIALKNWCEEEVKRLVGLEYRTTEHGMKPPSR